MQWADLNRAYYDSTVDFYDARVAGYIDRLILEEYAYFAQLAHLVDTKEHPSILDVGCGSGNHAERMREDGFDVYCTDISPGMVARCKEKGFEGEVVDMRKMNFERKFEGVFAYTSLLAIPHDDAPGVIRTIHDVLAPYGAFFLGLMEGTGVEERRREGDVCSRMMALYQHDDVLKLLDGFDVALATKTNLGQNTYLNYICQKTS